MKVIKQTCMRCAGRESVGQHAPHERDVTRRTQHGAEVTVVAEALRQEGGKP